MVLWFGGLVTLPDHQTTKPQNHKTNQGAAAGCKEGFRASRSEAKSGLQSAIEAPKQGLRPAKQPEALVNFTLNTISPKGRRFVVVV
jgi:hypothetical protein